MPRKLPTDCLENYIEIALKLHINCLEYKWTTHKLFKSYVGTSLRVKRVIILLPLYETSPYYDPTRQGA